MNKVQRIVLFVYAGLIALMTLFPPYQVTEQWKYGRSKGSIVVKAQYAPLWGPIPTYTANRIRGFGRIDSAKLLLQYAGATLVCSGLLLAFKEK